MLTISSPNQRTHPYEHSSPGKNPTTGPAPTCISPSTKPPTTSLPTWHCTHVHAWLTVNASPLPISLVLRFAQHVSLPGCHPFFNALWKRRARKGLQDKLWILGLPDFQQVGQPEKTCFPARLSQTLPSQARARICRGSRRLSDFVWYSPRVWNLNTSVCSRIKTWH